MTTKDRIDFLQRFIIVHSFLYYEADRSVIDDRYYDEVCKKLVKLKEENPDLWEKSQYRKQFGDDYNGATGFTLYHDLDNRQQCIIKSIAYGIAPMAHKNKK